MGCGIQRTQMHVLSIIQMQTGLVVWMIERVLQEDASTLVTIFLLDEQETKFCVSLYS